MYVRIPFSNFEIPIGRVCTTPQGTLFITQIKVSYTVHEGRGPCLRCSKDHEYGFIIHFIGDDIGGPGVRFDFSFTGNFCPECTIDINYAMALPRF